MLTAFRFKPKVDHGYKILKHPLRAHTQVHSVWSMKVNPQIMHWEWKKLHATPRHTVCWFHHLIPQPAAGTHRRLISQIVWNNSHEIVRVKHVFVNFLLCSQIAFIIIVLFKQALLLLLWQVRRKLLIQRQLDVASTDECSFHLDSSEIVRHCYP